MPSQAKPTAIIDRAYLRHLDEQDRHGYCHAEAGYAGPWRVVAVDNLFAVVREGDGSPEGLFKERETACLVAAVLPALGSNPLYAMKGEKDACGHRLSRVIGESGYEAAGWLRYCVGEMPPLLHPVEHLLRSPGSLSLFLEAASHNVLTYASAMLRRRLSVHGKA